LTQIQIESIGSGSSKRATAAAPAATPKEPAAPKETPAAPKETPAAAEAPAAAAPAAAAHAPKDYPDYTIADIEEKAKRWRLEQVEAALEYERAHANRKGAIAVLEATIEAKKERQ
jgi:hypothetical protein